MLSARCASQLVGDLYKMMPYSVLYNLSSAQISHKGDVQMAGMMFKQALEIE